MSISKAKHPEAIVITPLRPLDAHTIQYAIAAVQMVEARGTRAEWKPVDARSVPVAAGQRWLVNVSETADAVAVVASDPAAVDHDVVYTAHQLVSVEDAIAHAVRAFMGRRQH